MGNSHTKDSSVSTKDAKPKRNYTDYVKKVVVDLDAIVKQDINKYEFPAHSPNYGHQWIIRLKLDEQRQFIDVTLEMYINALSDWTFFATIKCSVYKNNYEKTNHQKTPKHMKFSEGQTYVFEKFLEVNVATWKTKKYIFPEDVLVLELEFKEEAIRKGDIRFYPGKEAHFFTSMENCWKMFGETQLTDVLLVVKKEAIAAHSLVLSAASNVFREIFENARNEGSVRATFDFSDYKYETVWTMVCFAYFGSIIQTPTEDLEVSLKLADELQFKHFKAYCENRLMNEVNYLNAEKYIELSITYKARSLHEYSRIIMERAKESGFAKNIKKMKKEGQEIDNRNRTVELAKKLMLGSSKMSSTDAASVYAVRQDTARIPSTVDSNIIELKTK